MTIAEVISDMLKYTLVAFRFHPRETLGGMILVCCVNTTIRLAALWLTIVVACHALRFA